MKLILIFLRIIKKRKVDKNGHKDILFRIDVYFSEYKLAVEVDEKEILFLKRKYRKHQKKILDCKFIRNYPNKENYDVFYEIGRMQTFISKFENKT